MPERSERLLPGEAPAPTLWKRFRRAASVGKDRRGDLTVAALGITLGLLCVTFPWYIFMNPEKFGTGASAFRIVPGFGSGRATVSPTLPRQGPPKENEGGLPADLDLFATGTAAEAEQPPPPAEQPLPPPPPPVFHVVHIENGRAMIEDDSGLYLVGTGDRLPDGSLVTGFAEREGKPVVLTSTDGALPAGE